jgi:hypothetical protein
MQSAHQEQYVGAFGDLQQAVEQFFYAERHGSEKNSSVWHFGSIKAEDL